MTKITVLDKFRRTRKPVLVKKLVSRDEYVDLLETIEVYLQQLQRMKEQPEKWDHTVNIIKEMKFNALLNHKFRQETFDNLKDLADDLYAEIHT